MGFVGSSAAAPAGKTKTSRGSARWEKAARRAGIPVSVADCEAECTFYFPAICTGQDLVAGLVSTGKDHHKTAQAARAVRKTLEELE